MLLKFFGALQSVFEQVANNSCFILRGWFVPGQAGLYQDRLGTWAKVSSTKFNKAKCLVLPLRHNNLMGWCLLPDLYNKGWQALEQTAQGSAGVTILGELERGAAVALRDGQGLVVDRAVLG